MQYSRSRSIGLISPILLAPLPLASRVYQVQIQVRYANSSSPKSNLAYQGNAWKITSDCTDLQYLQIGDKDMTKWACKSCPEGASCAGSITQYGIKARFGWWRESKTSKVLYRCLHRAACLGAPNPLLETQFPNARTDSNETCDLAIFKPSRLCATCKEGYARGTGNGSCNRCHPVSNVVLFVFALIVGALGLLFLVRITVFKPRVVRLSDGIKKVGLSYLQLATLAMQVDVPWTEQLEQLFAWQSFSSNVSDAVLSLDCVLGWSAFNTFRLKFIMVMATPPLHCRGLVRWDTRHPRHAIPVPRHGDIALVLGVPIDRRQGGHAVHVHFDLAKRRTWCWTPKWCVGKGITWCFLSLGWWPLSCTCWACRWPGTWGFDGQIEGAWMPARSLASCTMVTTKSVGGGK